MAGHVPMASSCRAGERGGDGGFECRRGSAGELRRFVLAQVSPWPGYQHSPLGVCCRYRGISERQVVRLLNGRQEGFTAEASMADPGGPGRGLHANRRPSLRLVRHDVFEEAGSCSGPATGSGFKVERSLSRAVIGGGSLVGRSGELRPDAPRIHRGGAVGQRDVARLVAGAILVDHFNDARKLDVKGAAAATRQQGRVAGRPGASRRRMPVPARKIRRQKLPPSDANNLL